jgi:FecR protein
MIAPNRFNRFGLSLAVLVAFVGLSASAHADTSSTRAARLTYIQGTVTVNEPNNGESVPAQPNLPLLAGVQLVTGNDGQAEVEFEDGSIVRLTPNSVLSLDNLAIEPDGDFVTNLSLLSGLAYCELRATPQYRYFIDAGGDILSPVENTTVRVNFDASPAIFSVLDGTAQVERQGAPNSDGPSTGYQTQVRAGESLRSDGNRYFLSQQIADDSWDQWNEDRDQAATTEASDSTAVRDNYAGAEGYGWSDLDANGDWYNVPGQGTIWQPQVAVDDPSFDPYGNGAWVYSNSGYLWASSYSWGWTPYRCGNWSYYNNFGWGWAPGAGCGGRGWGFGGGGRPVNIVIGPTGYQPIRVPFSGGPHPRPIWPIHTPSGSTRTAPTSGLSRGPRRIAGVTVQPIAREHSGPAPGGGGSALRRDFPIDSSNRTPVLGLASTSPTVVHTSSGLHTVDQGPRPTAARQPDQTPGQPETYGGRRYPSNVRPAPANAASQPQGARPDPSAPETRRPADNSAPARPAMDRYPSYNRPADNIAPSQPPANQNPAPRRPDQQSAPMPRPSEPPPSYQGNSPQPTVRSAPPADRTVERSSPPPAERNAPPPPPPQPSRPASSPAPPQPAPRPTTQSGPARTSPN